MSAEARTLHNYLMGTLVIGGRDAERFREAATHLPGLETAVTKAWPEDVASVLPARLLPPLLTNLYLAIDELMDAFRLDEATLQAAEPFIPDDFWIPGYSFGENLALLCGGPLPDDAATRHRLDSKTWSAPRAEP